MTIYISQDKGFAQLCPVCSGKGEIGKGKAKHDAYPIGKTKGGRYVFECHACGGNGVIKLNLPQLPSQPINDNDSNFNKFWYYNQWVSSDKLYAASEYDSYSSNCESFSLDDKTQMGLPL